jgi:hypothetical protein
MQPEMQIVVPVFMAGKMAGRFGKSKRAAA